MKNEEIRKKLIELIDVKYKEFNSNLCPGINNILGVRIPDLRKLAKEIVKDGDWEEYLQNAQDDYNEEKILQALVIGLAKMDIKKCSKYLEMFIPKIDNWAVCDTLVSGLKITKNNMEYMWKFIDKYLHSNKEFEIRFGIVMILNYYINEEYIERSLEILNNIKHEGYYVKMAVAWAISIAYIKQQEKTMKLLKNNKLDDFTYNKSLQKITESYRIDDETKRTIRSMKR